MAKKKDQDFVYAETVIRFFGIPFYSKVISINEDKLYDKMQKRFAEQLNKSLDEKMNTVPHE